MGKLETHETSISQKIEMEDYAAGSGSLIGLKMKKIRKCIIVIDDTKYQIAPEKYDRCEPGTPARFIRKAKSKKLVNIEVYVDEEWVSV